MTFVWHGDDHELGGSRVRIAAARDPTGPLGLAVLGGDELGSLGAAAPDKHLMSGRSKSPGQTATLGSRAAEDAYLHPANVLARPE